MNNLLGKWGRPGRPPKQAYQQQSESDRSIKYHVQKDYLGAEEELFKSDYPLQIQCSHCGQVRWIRIQDKHQVTMCKPCTRHFRLERRRQRAADLVIQKKIEQEEERLSFEDIDEE